MTRVLLLTLLALLAVPAAASASADVYGHARAGRVILLHGLSGDRSIATTPPVDAMRRELVAHGWQVVVPSLPYDLGVGQAPAVRHAVRGDGGAAYAARWHRRFARLVAWAERHHGHAHRLIVGGISWGGLHALRAACEFPEIDGYFAHEPALDPNVLTEFAGVDVRHLMLPAGCTKRLAAMRGYLSYGTADTRVGTDAVRSLIARLRAAHAHLTTRVYPGLDHSTTPEVARALAAWVKR